ncbi:hypothetical protein HDU97_000259 [Phlyctochytrium planicorne]|nr:hypothetical protein HDU97_000259 [Phlyctochytrium planicorne]
MGINEHLTIDVWREDKEPEIQRESIVFKPSWTIAELKNHLKNVTGLGVNELVILFQDHQLTDNIRISRDELKILRQHGGFRLRKRTQSCGNKRLFSKGIRGLPAFLARSFGMFTSDGKPIEMYTPPPPHTSIPPPPPPAVPANPPPPMDPVHMYPADFNTVAYDGSLALAAEAEVWSQGGSGLSNQSSFEAPQTPLNSGNGGCCSNKRKSPGACDEEVEIGGKSVLLSPSPMLEILGNDASSPSMNCFVASMGGSEGMVSPATSPVRKSSSSNSLSTLMEVHREGEDLENAQEDSESDGHPRKRFRSDDSESSSVGNVGADCFQNVGMQIQIESSSHGGLSNIVQIPSPILMSLPPPPTASTSTLMEISFSTDLASPLPPYANASSIPGLPNFQTHQPLHIETPIFETFTPASNILPSPSPPSPLTGITEMGTMHLPPPVQDTRTLSMVYPILEHSVVSSPSSCARRTSPSPSPPLAGDETIERKIEEDDRCEMASLPTPISPPLPPSEDGDVEERAKCLKEGWCREVSGLGGATEGVGQIVGVGGESSN